MLKWVQDSSFFDSTCTDADFHSTFMMLLLLILIVSRGLFDCEVILMVLLAEYMKKYYVTEFEESMASKKRHDDAKAQADIKLARENFQPLYFTRSYASDKKKIEMSFDL